MDGAARLIEPLPLLLVVAAYLIGGIPSGVWLARLAGIDVRRQGSGNIGATNVARTAGLRLGLFTLVADLTKGALPTTVALLWTSNAPIACIAGGAAVVGHLLPPLLSFRGGKGVATAAGVFLVLAPAALLAAIAVFAATVLTTRYVSLASILAALTLPVAAGLLAYPIQITVLAVLIAGAILVRHRSNLERLRRGEEPKFPGSRQNRET